MTSRFPCLCLPGLRGLSPWVAVGLALFANVPAHAQLTVTLQQFGGPPITVSGTQTIAFADLVVSGSFDPQEVSGFQTTLSWTGNVAATDLYTVNSSGLPATDLTFISANSPGFLFYDVSDPENAPDRFGSAPTASSRDIQINWAGDPLDPPTLTSGVTIARLRFAVAANVSEAEFAFTFNDNFFVAANLDPIPFNNGGGELIVVPEPGTIPACLVGLVVIGGCAARRSRRHLASSAAAFMTLSAARA